MGKLFICFYLKPNAFPEMGHQYSLCIFRLIAGTVSVKHWPANEAQNKWKDLLPYGRMNKIDLEFVAFSSFKWLLEMVG